MSTDPLRHAVQPPSTTGVESGEPYEGMRHMGAGTDGLEPLLREARANGAILRWPLPPGLTDEAKVAYRNRHAEAVAQQAPAEIIARWVYMTRAQMEGFVPLATKMVWREPLRGIGIELGAGCGLLSSIVARDPGVRAVFAVEVCEQTASRIIPKVAAWVLGADAAKVVPVVGTFDALHLPDDSLDFAVEIDSLHHSDDLVPTLRECARVLKPGGRLLCFDRCHPDRITDEQIDALLGQVYTRDFLIANNYPPDVVLTRRENGEHEYRLSQWTAAFAGAGLTLVKRVECRAAIPARAAVKGMLSLLPTRVRRYMYQSDGPTPRTTLLWLGQQLQAATRLSWRRLPVLAPKTTTVFALAKSARLRN